MRRTSAEWLYSPFLVSPLGLGVVNHAGRLEGGGELSDDDDEERSISVVTSPELSVTSGPLSWQRFTVSNIRLADLVIGPGVLTGVAGVSLRERDGVPFVTAEDEYFVADMLYGGRTYTSNAALLLMKCPHLKLCPASAQPHAHPTVGSGTR